ncbi:MAG: TRAP transporter substrate-binding protein [Oliverpabstia sp.]
MKFAKIAKRGLCVLTASVLMISTLTGCSGQDGESKGKLVKIAVCVSAQTPAAVALEEVFKPMVEEKTGNKYDIQIYNSSVLGSEKVTYDYTRNGIIEMCVVGTSMWSETPKMAIPDFPFMFRDVEHARRCYQGELGSYIADDIEGSQPVQLLSWLPNGARVFTSNKKLESLDDFKGQKLRMPNNPIHVKLAESLGANVVIMDMGEVFTALEQGVADGQDNPLATVKTEGWYEVQDYVYNTNHIIASLELFAGDEFWNSIDEEDQAIFEEAAAEASDYAWDLYIEQLESDKQFMKDEGLTFTELSEEDREIMLEKIQPVYDYLESQYDWVPEVREMVDNIE